MKNIIFIIFSLFAFQITIAQELEILVHEALENSPTIQQFELKYSIAKEKITEVNTLPNTELGIGYFISEPETRTGAQKARISVRQMLPWFGSITARENYISSLADATYEDIVIAKRKLLLDVSQSYYNLYTLQSKQAVFVENRKLLKTYETLALTSIETGKASVVDVLKLQMRQNELEQFEQELKHQYLAEQSKFNKLLNRDKAMAVEVKELIMPDENAYVNLKDLQLHPELTKYDKLYQSIEQSELMNKKESAPNIGFGLDYISVAERPDMTFSENGKDIVMPMVTLSIPLFNKKYKSKTKQNILIQQEIKAQKQDRNNVLEAILENALNQRISSRISYYTQVKNIEKAKNAEDILLKNYETGTINFSDVLDIQELQLKFMINKIKAIQQYYLQTSTINYLTK